MTEPSVAGCARVARATARAGHPHGPFWQLEPVHALPQLRHALDPRERRIVHLRFFEEMTQSQIAAELGISQMHVSRLLRNALDAMRGSIEARGGVR